MPASFPPASDARRRHLAVRLTSDEHAQLVALADARGRTISEVVRCSLPLRRDGIAAANASGVPQSGMHLEARPAEHHE